MIRLENELTKVQGKKIKMIETLARIQGEKENEKNAAVDDWIKAVMGDEDEKKD